MAPEDKPFLDAGVLIAAAASPIRESGLVMELCRARKATPLVSRLVLIEVERNIRKRFEESVLVRYYARGTRPLMPFPHSSIGS